MSRATEAARTILAFAARGRAAPPLHYVEAAAIAPLHKRQAAIAEAAAQVVAARDPVAEVEGIARAFLSRPPRADTTPDGPVADHGNTQVVVPGERQAEDRPEDVGPPARDDGRRSLDEVESACAVICEATLRDFGLCQVTAGVGLDVRLLAGRCRDTSTAARLRACADRLRDASKAAGTATAGAHMRRRDAQVDDLVANGAGVDEVHDALELGRQFDELVASGHRLSMSRSEFINHNRRRACQ